MALSSEQPYVDVKVTVVRDVWRTVHDHKSGRVRERHYAVFAVGNMAIKSTRLSRATALQLVASGARYEDRSA